MLYRCILVVSAMLVGGLAQAQENKVEPKSDPLKIEKTGKPLIDTAAFLRDHDRNKDGALTKDEMPEWLLYNFARLDANKDGRVTQDELDRGVAYLQQRRRPSDVVFVLIEMSDCDDGCSDEIQRVYSLLFRMDKNQDGKLDDEEIKAGRAQLVKDRVDGIFKRLDANADGKISADEARGMVKEHFKQLDRNSDGFIDRDELTAEINARPLAAKDTPAPKK